MEEEDVSLLLYYFFKKKVENIHPTQKLLCQRFAWFALFARFWLCPLWSPEPVVDLLW